MLHHTPSVLPERPDDLDHVGTSTVLEVVQTVVDGDEGDGFGFLDPLGVFGFAEAEGGADFGEGERGDFVEELLEFLRVDGRKEVFALGENLSALDEGRAEFLHRDADGSGTLLVLEKGAVFGPLIAGPDGAMLFETWAGDPRPVPLARWLVAPDADPLTPVWTLAWGAAALLLAGLPFRLSSQYWRFAGVNDLLGVAAASIAAAALYPVLLHELGVALPSPSFPLAHALCLASLLGASRAAYRLMIQGDQAPADRPGVLLIGAGEGADLFIRALAADRARCNVVKMSELGLVEMTRQRTRESLGRQLQETCWYCEGRGALKSKRTVVYEILRALMRQAPRLLEEVIVVQAHPDE
jgi:hypothetical protein